MKKVLLMFLFAGLFSSLCLAGEDEDYIAAMEAYNRQNYREEIGRAHV